MTAPTGYNLVWADEFDGTSLNTSNWKQTVGNSSQIKVANSQLTMTANVGNFNGSVFLSTPKTFQYGYYECSAQISTTQGVAFAFWLLDPGSTPTEIDVVERPGNASGYQNLCVFSLNNGSGWSSGGVHQSFPATATGFHKYAVLWTPTDMIYYVDDVETWRATQANASKVKIPLNVKLDICAGGCSFQGITIPTNSSGQTSAIVDYVRIYQQGGTPIPTPNPPAEALRQVQALLTQAQTIIATALQA
jgi:beta-glucanase (GH16 family)